MKKVYMIQDTDNDISLFFSLETLKEELINSYGIEETKVKKITKGKLQGDTKIKIFISSSYSLNISKEDIF